MKVKKFLEQWYDRTIEDWGGTTSQEYKDFQRGYRNVLKEIGNEIGMELHSFNKNHYDFSAVMKSNKTEQFYYISISDVRYFKNEWANNILYRTMANDKDWTGGSNHYCSLKELSESLVLMDNQLLKNNEKENTRQVNYQDATQKSIEDDFEINYA